MRRQTGKPGERLSAAQHSTASGNYYRWECKEATIGNVALGLFSKPGVAFFGEADPSTRLLAESLKSDRSGVVLNLNCGAGLVGALAARSNQDGRVVMTDRNFLAVEAARRTLEHNSIKNAEVYLTHGLGALPMPQNVDLVLIRLPKGKLPALQLIWDAFRALKIGGCCRIAGGNNEGVQSVLRYAQELFGNARVLAYRRGHRLGSIVKNATEPVDMTRFTAEVVDRNFFGTFSVQARGISLCMYARPGVFAWDRLDEGSRILIDQMEVHAGENVLELGGGAGPIGLVAARLCGNGHVDIVEVDSEAIRSMEKSTIENGISNCFILPGDAGSAVKGRSYDIVVTNPPFHIGKVSELSTAFQFIRDAAELLRKAGRFYLVANVTLPYERPVFQSFGNVEELFQDRGYKVMRALKKTA
jgi:16S rRNA (guanine1207-N2)-methyltransferase